MTVQDAMSGGAVGRMDLLSLSPVELEELLAGWGQPRFRAGQVWRWLYHNLAAGPEEMGNLPAALRQHLAEEATLAPLEVVDTLVDADGLTEKVVLRAADGELLETVLMRYAERNSVCVSTQVGCAIGCAFCATGQSGFVRDLTAGEIIAQVLYYGRRLRAEGQAVTNVVFMGMGEPLLNYDAVWRAVTNLNDGQGLGLGARRMTISTAGVAPGIMRLADETLEVGLAVSLHAPNDALRNELVPLNRRYPLAQVLDAVREYIARTRRRVTFEYALIQDVNDSIALAHETGRLLRGLLCHVNLIPLNPTAEGTQRGSPPERVADFERILALEKIPVTVRLRRGVDIQAGCGQLRGRHLAAKAEGSTGNDG
jgi:23S rRNA (adenine2503-C2)-methyltransferase